MKRRAKVVLIIKPDKIAVIAQLDAEEPLLTPKAKAIFKLKQQLQMSNQLVNLLKIL
ncbi:MAG: hypothetical protein LBF97_07145 [Elusimicrobiota bacterium]|nr:hypothetical protein [Elusimicrobiota bacterium]